MFGQEGNELQIAMSFLAAEIEPQTQTEPRTRPEPKMATVAQCRDSDMSKFISGDTEGRG